MEPAAHAIFDATDFVNYHPGSAELLRDAGRVDDAEFFDLAHPSAARCSARSSSPASRRCRPPRAPKPSSGRCSTPSRWLASRWRRDEGEGAQKCEVITCLVCYELMGAGAPSRVRGPSCPARAAFASSWLYGVFVVSSLRRRRCFALALCAVSAASLT